MNRPSPPPGGMRTFAQVLANTAVANLTTNFLWFSLVFWVYLETRSILASGILSGGYMILLAASSMWFGSLVDRMRKIRVMRLSAWTSLLAFAIGAAIFFAVPQPTLLRLDGPWFWFFALVLLAGCVVELMRNLALATTVTLLVPDERHANANGLVGAVQGLAFIATSVFSGLSVGLLGMPATIVIALVLTALPVAHLHLLRIAEPEVVHDPNRRAIDFRGGWLAILAVPGLLGLIMFTTLNNLSGGVYMALLDPYGLTMFPVEVWGMVFGLAGTGFLIGGALVAKFGLGANPIRAMLLLVIVVGVIGATFTLREWPWLFITGMWLFMLVMPAIEAAEQTVIQRVVPYDRQGRVFGLAMTFEAATAPLTALVIAPLAELLIVPYVSSPAGAATWAPLLGAGESRGIALTFFWSGLAVIALGAAAFGTRTYRTLTRSYRDAAPAPTGALGRDAATDASSTA